MEPKPCSRCWRPADFSIALLLSTVRVRPQVQKCSQTIALCNSCMRDVLASLGTSRLADLQQPFISAYTAVVALSDIPLNGDESQDSANAEPHQDGEAAVSSRPCLIAGNLRKFTRDDIGTLHGYSGNQKAKIRLLPMHGISGQMRIAVCASRKTRKTTRSASAGYPDPGYGSDAVAACLAERAKHVLRSEAARVSTAGAAAGGHPETYGSGIFG